MEHWTDLAKLLEQGKVDGLFLADVLGTYDVYQGKADVVIRQGIQTPVNDPLLIVSAMAQVTEHLGFGVTCALTYEHPYSFARRASTLDHLTIFVSVPSATIVKSYVRDLRKSAAEFGRESVLIFLMFTIIPIIVAPPDDEAAAKFDEYWSYVDYEGALALMS